MVDSIPLKCCIVCGVEKPFTEEYFAVAKGNSSGLRGKCRACHNASVAKRKRERYQCDAEFRASVLQYEKDIRRTNPDFADRDREKRRIRVRVRRKNPVIRDQMNAYERERRNNPDYRNKRNATQRERKRLRYHSDTAFQDRLQTNDKKYRNSDKGKRKRRLDKTRRRTRKRNLPNTFTLEQWENALQYFGGCCAACGRQLNGLFHTASPDHWIPLSSSNCPGTIQSNIVPLCHGTNGCNNSKSNRDAEEWLRWRFGKRRAKEILKRISAYFESFK